MAKKVFNVITTIFLIILVLLVIMMFLMRLSGKSPSIFGYHVYRVSSDSMEPELMVGDVILVARTSADNIQKGDIITYKAVQGTMTGQDITHRVVTDPVENNGSYIFQTQGDAAGASLDPKITDDQVIGKFVCKIPLLDKLYSFFLKPYGLLTILAVIFVMFGYEMVSLMVSYKAIDNIGVEAEIAVGADPGEEGGDSPDDADVQS